MNARRQAVLDALVAIQERRMFKPPLRVTALAPSRYPPDHAGFWSFVDARGRVAVAFAMSRDDLTPIATTLFDDTRNTEITLLRDELGTPMV